MIRRQIPLVILLSGALSLPFSPARGAPAPGALPVLSNEDRLDLEKADGVMKEADKSLKELDARKSEVREGIEKKIETARSLLRGANYHGGRERVMEAHRELGLARDALEEKEKSGAREHLSRSRELLAKALAERSDVFEVPFARPGGQDYLQETREVRPGGEVHAEQEVTAEERSGAAKPKRKEECDRCDGTSESGEWMKDAAHSGNGSP